MKDYPIRVYHAKDTTFAGIGLCGDLFPISCEFECVGNGLSQITLVHPIDSIGKYKFLRDEYIISAFVPSMRIGVNNSPDIINSWERRQQYFRIFSVEITSANTITVKAKHIFYDLSYYVNRFSSAYIDRKTSVEELINDLNESHYYIGGQMPFSFHTDIESESFYAESYMDRDAASIILDPEIGLCNVMSACLVRDNYDAYILRNAGYDRGITIEYAKNMKYVSMTTDSSEVATRIRPIGTNADGDSMYLDTNEGCVDSPHINDYAFQKVVTLTVGDASVSDDMTVSQAKELMRDEAQKQFDNGIDMPKVSIRVEFSKLSDDPKYKQYRDLEKVFIFDYIRVIYPELGIDHKLRVTRIIYDVVTGILLSIELGELQDLAPTISGWQISGGINASKIVGKSATPEPDVSKFCQSGKVADAFYDQGQNIVNVAFPKQFDKIPSVCVTIANNTDSSAYTLTIASVSKNGFVLHVYGSSEMSQEIGINWIAVRN